jgi:uncharacterized membrane protein YcaP (DUF421 family)
MLIMNPEWVAALVRGLMLTAAAVLWTLLLARIVGLRAFSKMTAFDFVATIAVGSLIAQAGTRDRLPDFLQAMAGIGGVFLVQWVLAKARLNSKALQRLIRNRPVLLMEHGHYLEQAMRETRVSRQNLDEKLRQAGVGDVATVRAVVLETTGDMSVIKEDVDERLLDGVARV